MGLVLWKVCVVVNREGFLLSLSLLLFEAVRCRHEMWLILCIASFCLQRWVGLRLWCSNANYVLSKYLFIIHIFVLHNTCVSSTLEEKKNGCQLFYVFFLFLLFDLTAMGRSKRSGNKSLSDHEYCIAHILKLGWLIVKGERRPSTKTCLFLSL